MHLTLSEKEIIAALKAKGIVPNLKNIQTLGHNLEQASNKVYNVVCLDIDGTLCGGSRDFPSDDIVKVIMSLVEKKTVIVFITGRGRGGARSFISELRRKLLDGNKSIPTSYFKNRWYCITHSGAYLLFSTGERYNDFLKEEKFLIQEDVIEESKKYLNKIIPQAEKYCADEKCEFEISSEPAGARVLFPKRCEMAKALKLHLTSKLPTNSLLHFLEGRYMGKEVLEISCCDKSDAIRIVSEFLGVEPERILRVGDQGAEEQNDYGMLRAPQGFSVESCSSSIDSCFPVINKNGKHLRGLNATAYLLKNLLIYPSISISLPSSEKLHSELSQFEAIAFRKSREQLRFYSKSLSSSLIRDEYDISTLNLLDTFDTKSGAIKFRDWEWDMIPEDDVLKRLFSRQVGTAEDGSPRYSFMLKTDSGIVLRGVENYYAWLAFRDRCNPQWGVESLHKVVGFLKRASRVLQEHADDIEINKSYHRKMIVAIIDAARNFLLTILNSSIGVEKSRVFEVYSPSQLGADSKQILDFTNMNLKHLFDALFNNVYSFRLDRYVSLLSEILVYTDQNKAYLNKVIQLTPPRVWRETDFFIENLASIRDALNQLKQRYELRGNKIIFHGILYGGIELPLIAKILAQEEGFKAEICYHRINADYRDKHKLQHTESVDLSDYKDYFNVVLDDNLMTGKTCQLILNNFFLQRIFPQSLICVRYPSLNRKSQMFFKDHGSPDFSLFGSYILGLITATPYSRIFARNTTNENPYLDKTGIFNRGRHRIYRYIFKNGLFSNSEISSEFDL